MTNTLQKKRKSHVRIPINRQENDKEKTGRHDIIGNDCPDYTHSKRIQISITKITNK